MTSFLRISLVFLLVFLFPASLWAAEDEPIEVTVEELQENKEFYHGKRVKVEGVIGHQVPDRKLYESIENYVFWTLGEDVDSAISPITVTLGWNDSWRQKVDGLKESPPYSSRIFLEKTQVEIVGTLDAIPAGYDPENQTWMVVLDGPGIVINVEAIKIIDRPAFSSAFYKYLTEYDWIKEGDTLYFDIIKEDDAEYPELHQFVSEWVLALRSKDYKALKQTVAKEWDKEEEWQELDNPESLIHRKLFSPDTLIQIALSGGQTPQFVLHRQNEESPFFEDEFRAYDACFCLEDECKGVWPITLDMRVYRSLVDDFVCVYLGKEDGEWVWEF